MNNLTYKEIRDRYIKFFEKNGHTSIPSAPLVPEDDPSVLFVNAGMFPLVPFLKGQQHPKGTRLVNSQRCIRTGDIEEVGNNFHCTAFEMLGNWSLNDYFKKEAINFTVEFFVNELGLDIQKMYASVFGGEDNIPADETSIQVWKDLYAKHNIDAKIGERIQTYGKKENWWGLESGGPCGPDSEIFYDTGKPQCSNECHINCDCGKYVEIGNNVFMEYLNENGQLKPLGRHNVDFGGGLERLSALLQNVDNIYEIDIYKPVLEKIQSISKTPNIKSQRVIVDHLKASTLIIMDGILPGRSQQAYILRRLIRRSIRHAKTLGIEETFTKEIVEKIIEQFSTIYPNLEQKKEHIINTIQEEEIKFNKTLENGLRELDRILQRKETLDGTKAFQIYETYGLPLELTEEILQEKGFKLENRELFQEAEQQHQEKSRTASKGLFKGGLADTSEMSTKYHTTTHLLLAALRKVLGDHVHQKGSNITPERLRLDFPNEAKLTPEQVKQVEDIVNDAISQKLDITYEEVSKEKALETIATEKSSASFTEKYGDIVKLYYVGPKENPFSVEICNGPHVSNTQELGTFKIAKQENVGAGIKRIKATLQ